MHRKHLAHIVEVDTPNGRRRYRIETRAASPFHALRAAMAEAERIARTACDRINAASAVTLPD
jgi:hypothetical protein